MKIFYSAGNRPGAFLQFKDILANNTSHKIRSAGYSSKTDEDLTKLITKKADRKEINSIFGFSPSYIPKLATIPTTYLLERIIKFKPDLIIADNEPIVSYMAHTLNIPLLYCSSLHAIDGINWRKEKMGYYQAFQKTWLSLYKLPPPQKVLIYSPFGDITSRLELKPGYQWVQPYHSSEPIIPELNVLNVSQDRKNKIVKLLKSLNIPHQYQENINKAQWVLTCGYTSWLANIIYHQVPFCVAPDNQDPETLINAFICQLLELGQDLGQIELMEKFGQDELEKVFADQKSYLVNKQQSTLFKIIEETYPE